MKCNLHCGKVKFYRINHNQPPRRSNEEIKQAKSRFNAKERVVAYHELVKVEYGLNSRLLLIQQLLPIGFQQVEEALHEKATELAGLRYNRKGSAKR